MFVPSGDFLHRRAAPGVDLFLMPTRRFKTVLVRACLLQPLTAERAAAMSLSAAVVRQGTADHPTRRDLYGALEDLHGAELGLDTGRIGEVHLLEADLDMPSDRFSRERGALSRGIRLLAEVLGRPRLEGWGFPAALVKQERVNLLDALAAAVNHKPSYANRRCLETACPGEPFRIGRLGTPEALGRLAPPALAEFWQESVSRLPLTVHAVGDFEPEAVAEGLAGAILPMRSARPDPRPPVGFRRAFPTEPRVASERKALSQVRLCLAWRTNTPGSAKGFAGLAMAQMILGGGSHAKLFREVREKASLAYDPCASLERAKGLLLVSAGVDAAQRARAEALLLAQVEALREGRISGREWTDSRRTLLNALKSSQDSAAQRISAHLEGWILGKPRTAPEIRAAILEATPADAVAAARRMAHAATFRLLGLRSPSR